MGHTPTRRWNEWETLLRLLTPQQTYHGSEEQVEASFFELQQDAACDLLQSGAPRVAWTFCFGAL
ncbi:unnamed protein product [Symbiodinium sp. CCMP2456]|nr:unnamed protein product [Symbiodinium sp. CCMP2456]